MSAGGAAESWRTAGLSNTQEIGKQAGIIAASLAQSFDSAAFARQHFVQPAPTGRAAGSVAAGSATKRKAATPAAANGSTSVASGSTAANGTSAANGSTSAATSSTSAATGSTAANGTSAADGSTSAADGSTSAANGSVSNGSAHAPPVKKRKGPKPNRHVTAECTPILEGLMKRTEAKEWFNDPVDLDEAEGYAAAVPEPLDFGTIAARLAEGAYASASAFADDVRKVGANAVAYSPDPDNACHIAARAMVLAFERAYFKAGLATDDGETLRAAEQATARKRAFR